jgi:hypothetical protein
MNATATAQDYQVGAAALAVVIAAAIKANVPEFMQGDVPAGLAQQIEQQGAKAVIDAVDAHRAKADSAKGMD